MSIRRNFFYNMELCMAPEFLRENGTGWLLICFCIQISGIWAIICPGGGVIGGGAEVIGGGGAWLYTK